MASVGVGTGLLVLAIIAAILSERFWLRVLCGVYVGVYFVLTLYLLLTGCLSVTDTGTPVLLALLAWFVASVKKSYSKW